MTKTNWFGLSPDQQEELYIVVPTSRWRLLRQAELPSVFPQPFRAKLDSAILVSTPTSTGGLYLAYCANRVDLKDRKIDIEPFGLILNSTGPTPSGVFLHHGDWPGRSEAPAQAFWDVVTASGIGNYFYSNPPNGLREGTIDQLPKGHRNAFEAIVHTLRTKE